MEAVVCNPMAFEEKNSLNVVVVGGAYANPTSIHGLAAARESRRTPAAVVLTDRAEAESIEPLLRAGAKGVVASRTSPTSLIHAIRSVARGGSWQDPLLEADEDPAPPGWRTVTPRERQVAELMADGLRYGEIAERLGISAHTVRNHSRRIFAKLDVNNRVELAALLVDTLRRR